MKKWVPDRSCLVSCLVLVTVPPILILASCLVINELSCHEHIREEFASPRGQYIAQVVVIGCGGAAGSVDVEVRVRSVVEEPDGKGQTVFELGGSYGLSVYWEGKESLIIEHLCGATNIDTQHDRWRNVPIRYRCVDPQKAHLCNACGSWGSP